MQCIDLTPPTPEENLALDEALLDLCEVRELGEVLRFWEPRQHFVVVGYANAVGREVNADFCRERQLPILRRCTGGGTVLQGPGVLNYSLTLRLDRDPALQGIPGTNRYVLERHAAALTVLLGKPVRREGHTDLAMQGLKFSGNAQRRRKNSLLFHGSFLLDLDLDLLEAALPMPSKQPDYRLSRSHRDFLVNLNASPGLVKQRIADAWGAKNALQDLPVGRVATLVEDKYSRHEWNFKF